MIILSRRLDDKKRHTKALAGYVSEGGHFSHLLHASAPLPSPHTPSQRGVAVGVRVKLDTVAGMMTRLQERSQLPANKGKGKGMKRLGGVGGMGEGGREERRDGSSGSNANTAIGLASLLAPSSTLPFAYIYTPISHLQASIHTHKLLTLLRQEGLSAISSINDLVSGSGSLHLHPSSSSHTHTHAHQPSSHSNPHAQHGHMIVSHSPSEEVISAMCKQVGIIMFFALSDEGDTVNIR